MEYPIFRPLFLPDSRSVGVFYVRGVRVSADNNIYAVGLMRFEGKEYRSDDFLMYQEISKNDAASMFSGSSEKKDLDAVFISSSPSSWKGRGRMSHK